MGVFVEIFFFLTELRIVCTFAGKLFRSSQLDFIDTPKSCRLCKRYFSNGHELNEHVKSFSHLFSLDTGEYLPMGYVLWATIKEEIHKKFDFFFIFV